LNQHFNPTTTIGGRIIRLSPEQSYSMTREPYVDAAKAAEFLHLPVRYLTDLARAGRLPGYPLSMGARRNMWRFRLSELEQFMSKTGTNSTAPTERRTTRSRQSQRAENGQ
jgi:hypothetical protein